MEAVSPDETAAAIAAAIDALAPEGALGVAVSGGGDSTALLAVAADWARARGRRLEAATVDHGLRAESADEAAEVAGLCARLAVPHRTLTVGELGPGNLSARAREVRYGLLAGWARERGLGAILLGHTRDDQAETVLMRLARGSGADGLSAMSPAVTRLGILWLRPMLGISRGALRGLLESRGIGWIDDPTNEDPAYDRVRARQALAALAPLGLEAADLARSAARLRAQRRVLVAETARLAAGALAMGRAGEVLIRPGALRGEERETALRVVAHAVHALTGSAYPPRGRALAAALDALLEMPSRPLSLAGCLLRPGPPGDAFLCREAAAMAPSAVFSDRRAVWDGRWQAEGAVPDGATLGPLGDGDAADLALPPSIRGFPGLLRRGIPVIRIGGAITAAALPGAASESLAVTDLTAARLSARPSGAEGGGIDT